MENWMEDLEEEAMSRMQNDSRIRSLVARAIFSEDPPWDSWGRAVVWEEEAIEEEVLGREEIC
jgi:hypothetical protein